MSENDLSCVVKIKKLTPDAIVSHPDATRKHLTELTNERLVVDVLQNVASDAGLDSLKEVFLLIRSGENYDFDVR